MAIAWRASRISVERPRGKPLSANRHSLVAQVKRVRATTWWCWRNRRVAMAMILGGAMVISVGTMWLFARSPLGRAIGCSFEGFAEASRAEPGALH